jgi:EAL domain-containing protein (putative c-di-GMP-specific phosphodiesterase class I)
VVKLDRNLIEGLDRKRRQQKLVAATVRLCLELGALVVAEGIETPDEYMAVRDCGAQCGQGYLFARPGFPLPRIHWPPRAESEIRLTTRPVPHRLPNAK